jgi:hypothetical protein
MVVTAASMPSSLLWQLKRQWAVPCRTAKSAIDLVLEIAERIAKGEFGDEGFDDTLAIVVRKLGPRSSRGQAGAAAVPEEPFFG